MKTLVTGATGFVGRHLSKALAERGKYLRCLVREGSDVECLQEIGAELVYGDLLNKDRLDIATEDIDIIFHLAGNVYAKEMSRLYEINVIGTRNLLEVSSQKQIAKFIYLSSIAAMGSSKDGEALNEKDSCRPMTAYGESKLKAEDVIAHFVHRYKLPSVVVRVPTVYGPGVNYQSRVFYFLDAIHNEKFRIIGSGDNIISVCYVDDLVNALITMGDTRGIEGNTYLISSGELHSLQEIAQCIATLENKRLPRFKVPLPLAECAVSIVASLRVIKLMRLPLGRELLREMTSNWVVDISKAQEELRYKPKVNLCDGMTKTIEWYLIHHKN